jgi:hypothetical protein
MIDFKMYGETEQDTAILPSEYQQVEYIQSSGTQYIETNVNLSNDSFKISTKMSVTEFEQQEQAIMSIWLSNYSYWNCFITTSKKISLYLGGHNIIDKVLELNKQYNLEVERINNSDWKVSLDNDTVNANYSPSSTNETTLKLFTRGDVPATSYSNTHIKMYGCKIIKINTLVRNFIPCYRKSDNVIGLYDLVNNVFYTNAGTGTFTKGNDVTLPTLDYPQDVKVVTGDNTINVCGKNILPQSSSSTSINGVTFTVNDDKTIIVDGTATAEINYAIKGNFPLVATTNYRLTGCPSGGSTSTYMLRYTNTSWSQNAFDIGSGVTFYPYAKPENSSVVIQIKNGTVCDNLIFKPMLTLASITDNTYEPYKNFTQEINLGKNLFDKTKVTSGYYINSNGELISNNELSVSDYINILGKSKITLSGMTTITTS